MEIIITAIICLAIGAVVGFLFHKSKVQQVLIDREVLTREIELLKGQHEETLKTAQSVMLEASEKVATKLLDHHKRENAESRKAAEEITKKETESLHKEFKAVVEMLANVKGQTQIHDKKLSTIWQSLTSPVKSANFAEIGLENTLKGFGLEQGNDFMTQATLDNGRLRPDAIINLPGGNLIIIDAKTSKFFIEIAAAENNEEHLKERLKNSMTKHLRDLATRDYTAAGKAKADDIYVTNVMYLATDSAYSRVVECDPEYPQKCRDAGVLLVTPTSLHMLLTIATHQITRARQEKNYQVILKEMGKVISSVDVLLRQVHKIGKSIQDSARYYSELSKSVNVRLIPRVKTILKLGLEPENTIKMPDSLPEFNLVENQPVMIDTDVDETVVALDKKVG